MSSVEREQECAWSAWCQSTTASAGRAGQRLVWWEGQSPPPQDRHTGHQAVLATSTDVKQETGHNWMCLMCWARQGREVSCCHGMACSQAAGGTARERPQSHTTASNRAATAPYHCHHQTLHRLHLNSRHVGRAKSVSTDWPLLSWW